MTDWKIKRDPYYSNLYDKYGYDFILDAGFFEDKNIKNINIEDSLNIHCTSLYDFENIKEYDKPAILLATGSFAPFHYGHLDMALEAKSKIEEAGYNVITTYFSPDHDDYISEKIKSDILPIEKRIESILEVIKPRLKLNIDPWAGIFNNTALNFTDIIYRLQLYIKKYIGVDIPIFFICGGDNARFAKTFALKGHCVVIERPGYDNEVKRIIKEIKTFPNKKNILFSWANNTISSTKIRETYKPNVNKSTLNIRVENTEWIFFRKVKHLFEQNFKKLNIITTKSISETYKNNKISTTISLDPYVGDIKLRVSRVYDILGLKKVNYYLHDKIKFQNIIHELYVNNINEVDVFDDDIFSGGTIKYVRNLLSKYDIEVKRTFFNTCSQSEDEILDLRDFIYKSENGGLLMINKDGEYIRYPYIYPFVCPYIRASIQNPMKFSLDIWLANYYYYLSIDDDIAKECLGYYNFLKNFI